jgi:hypothetical protein
VYSIRAIKQRRLIGEAMVRSGVKWGEMEHIGNKQSALDYFTQLASLITFEGKGMRG